EAGEGGQERREHPQGEERPATHPQRGRAAGLGGGAAVGARFRAWSGVDRRGGERQAAALGGARQRHTVRISMLEVGSSRVGAGAGATRMLLPPSGTGTMPAE